MAEGIRKINEYVMQLGRTIVSTDVNNNFESFPLGTPFINSNGDLKVKKTGEEDWINFTPANIFLNKAITFNFIADKTLTNQQISNSTILGINIKDSEIITSKIANNAITTLKILDESVTNEKIANDAITNNKILDGTIQGSKLANDIVTNLHLKDDSVRTNHIQNNAITTAKVLDRNITANKIATLNIKTEHIVDSNITTAKIANLAVNTDKLANGCVTNAKLGSLQVTADKIADGSIITAKLGNLQVSNAKLADGCINNVKLADSAVNTRKIENNAVTADKLSKSLNDAINSSIKLDSTGVANVNGTLYVKNNISASGTITATKIYNAVYNDLAEGYIPGEELKPGDIVEIKEDGKVYKSDIFSGAIVGVVSDEYAECYGASEEELHNGEKVAVGLIGKVHVTVYGPIKIGQKVVCMGEGIGCAATGTPSAGLVGKALETSYQDGTKKVLCLIYPN